MMISTVSQTEWTFVSTVPTTQEMLQFHPNMWLLRASHTQQDDPIFIARYVAA